MANPYFTLGGNTFIFSKAPVYPIREPRERLQAMDRTAGGGLQVESLGAGIVRRRETWRNLTAADYAGLVNWFDVIANGAANAFIYTDTDGNAYTVRWVNSFDFEEGKAGWGGSIEFEFIN